MSESKQLSPGSFIREYEIVEVLGKGNTGVVYRVRHTLLDEFRAIKVITSTSEEDTNFVNRFIREAKILLKLRHPNLIHFYDFGSLDENVFFMVLEFLHGESALERVKRLQKIGYRDAVRIVREAALGLHRAHQQGIIHRDISPDNLVIVKKEDGTEVTKVIDFGIAKPAGQETKNFTKTNAFLGNPEFCSPEQCGILSADEVIDARSDIYSLGVTLYYLLTGRLPFVSETSAGYMTKHVVEPPQPISTHLAPQEYPPKLELLIAKALQKKRENRFSSMEEFADALDQVGNPLASAAAASTSPEAPKDPAKFLPGYVFLNRYRIERTIEGSKKGTVYQATDLQEGRTIALKMVSKLFMPPGKERARFVRGLRLAQKVQHPSVCRIYEVSEQDDILYVTMEYLEGTTLGEILQIEGRLRLSRAMPILKHLLAGLSEAHRMGVIHRNLKPQNIMIGPTGEVRLMDFATSISLDSEESQLISGTGEFVGTPSYMAPEQFNAGAPDPRTDIYSFGILMYHSLVGRLPFITRSLPALIFAHNNTPPENPSTIIPDFPSVLESIILKALAKNPNDRFQSVEEMRNALLSMEESAKKFRELFERGKHLYDRNQLREALSVWREAHALFPQDPAVRRCIAAVEDRLAHM